MAGTSIPRRFCELQRGAQLGLPGAIPLRCARVQAQVVARIPGDAEPRIDAVIRRVLRHEQHVVRVHLVVVEDFAHNSCTSTEADRDAGQTIRCFAKQRLGSRMCSDEDAVTARLHVETIRPIGIAIEEPGGPLERRRAAGRKAQFLRSGADVESLLHPVSRERRHLRIGERVVRNRIEHGNRVEVVSRRHTAKPISQVRWILYGARNIQILGRVKAAGKVRVVVPIGRVDSQPIGQVATGAWRGM